MSDLLPCPHCGAKGNPNGPLEWTGDEGPKPCHVYCWGCTAQGPSARTVDEAVAAWNRRAAPARLPDSPSTTQDETSLSTTKTTIGEAEGSGFTPGPWTVCGDNGAPYIVAFDGAEGITVAHVFGDIDAQLIAAAPEMFPALLALCRRTYDPGGGMDCDDEMKALADAGFAAIAKALGPSAQDTSDRQRNPGTPKDPEPAPLPIQTLKT